MTDHHHDVPDVSTEAIQQADEWIRAQKVSKDNSDKANPPYVSIVELAQQAEKKRQAYRRDHPKGNGHDTVRPEANPQETARIKQVEELAALSELEYQCQRKKVAQQLGFGVQALDAAVKAQRKKENPSQAPPKPRYSDDWASHLLYSQSGEIKDCPSNLIEIFDKHPEWVGRIRRNQLNGCTEIDGESLTESTLASAAHWCGVGLRMAVRGLTNLLAALNLVGSKHAYHPVIDYLDGLPPWDGTPRIDSLFADFLGSEQTAYSAYVARVLLCGLVARAYQPGCVVRQVPVLEGKEQIGKSRFVRHLGYPWSGEISSNVESGKQIAEDIRGFWVAELMEMDALNRASTSRIKSFISQRNDHYRPAYGHISEDHLRVTVFVGTINPNQAIALLHEEDENTRFLPLVVTHYEDNAFKAARDQLFAEAKTFFESHPMDWWQQSEEAQRLAVPYREARSIQDPWGELIAEFLTGQSEITIREILSNPAALDIPKDRQTRADATRVGKILRQQGWKVIRQIHAGPRVYGRSP